jgi:hypothetical protein
VRHSSFFYHIVGIVLGAAEKQMCRIHASWRVALMQDIYFWRYRKPIHGPRNSVRTHLASIYRENSISTPVRRAAPKPASAHRFMDDITFKSL